MTARNPGKPRPHTLSMLSKVFELFTLFYKPF